MKLFLFLLSFLANIHALSISIPKGLSLSDPFYEHALEMITTFNSKSTNFTQILEFLEQSSDLGNVEAASKLGELLFFGLPISPENPSIDEKYFTSEGVFKRDLKKAVSYFKRAYKTGSGDAAFFLSYLLQLTLLVNDFDEFLIEHLDLKSAIETFYRTGVERGSSYSRSAAASGYIRCENSLGSTEPYFVSNFTNLKYYKAPYFDKKCGDCLETAIEALVVGYETISYIAKMGGERRTIGRLDEEEANLFGDEAKKAMMLSEAYLEDAGGQENYIDLAESYMFGNPDLGIERNVQQAVDYYHRAADQGNVHAMENLGVLYSQGIGIPKNATKARELLEAAAEKGSVQALNGLGYIHLNGIGVKKDIKKAMQYMKKAADLGHVESMTNLGVFYLNGDGVDKDYDLAFDYFYKAAEAGHINGIFNLGIMYLYGYGTEDSCIDALELFNKAIAKGELADVTARAYSFYRQGDFQSAYLLYSLGSLLGFENAQLSAGHMWEKNSVPFHCRSEPIQCAAHFYTQAAHMHDSQWAYMKLGDIAYSGGLSFPHDYESAFLLYSDAYEEPQAIFNIAHMLSEGLGVEKDPEKAETLYSLIIQAASSGDYDQESAYPATIALYTLRTKEMLKTLPYLNETVSYILELVEFMY